MSRLQRSGELNDCNGRPTLVKLMHGIGLGAMLRISNTYRRPIYRKEPELSSSYSSIRCCSPSCNRRITAEEAPKFYQRRPRAQDLPRITSYHLQRATLPISVNFLTKACSGAAPWSSLKDSRLYKQVWFFSISNYSQAIWICPGDKTRFKTEAYVTKHG